MVKKIIFIPFLYYSSDPYFTLLAGELRKDYECYYVDSKESILNKFNIRKPGDLEILRTHFKDVIELTDNIDIGGSNIFYKSFKFHRHFQKLKKIIKNISPDLIVLSTDGTLTARYISRMHSPFPVIILQSTFINFYTKGKNTNKNFIKKLILKLIDPLTYPYTSNYNLFGLTIKKAHLFLWGESTACKYKTLKDDKYIHITGNPLITKENLRTNQLPRKILILIGHEQTHMEQSEHYQDIKKIIDNFPKYQFLIRNHPIYKNDPHFFKIFKNGGNCIIDNHYKNTNELILENDLIITGFSCSSIEALFQGKHVLHLRRHFDDCLDYWFKNAPITHFKNGEEVINYLKIHDWNTNISNNNDVKIYIDWIWNKTGKDSLNQITQNIKDIV
ncbi:MAG: hypothetical protein A2381_00890 [Bdellovibrionales bacterium RIFOXYB1_FULL_37_110]|nr:MAG: hypothetical protein A2417_01745 [Bdellovibrionales bacterium RIFOXYC1_FULL_37_79]OFZ58776.1 MAG: hypothetical protein A2381_00890 [Bdellovibrionales bacterium RIFOXYB1_FULL_37_110]OFZ64775.1 MAG: hypothetical protein A2577_06890 [Bdellovibrionales bacterium RIFOXYD1_FULL_36_51]